MKTIKLRASQLTGRALDWAVAVALGKAPAITTSLSGGMNITVDGWGLPNYSTNFSDSQPVISQHISKLVRMEGGGWLSSVTGSQRISVGVSMQQAACRAFVRNCNPSGDIEVPEVLVEKLSSLPVGVSS